MKNGKFQAAGTPDELILSMPETATLKDVFLYYFGEKMNKSNVTI